MTILCGHFIFQVFFLKPDVLGPVDIPGGVVGDFHAASTWLQGLGYPALQLDPAWWQAQAARVPQWNSVVRNFQRGLHDYLAVMTLLEMSVGEVLQPVCDWRNSK